MLIIDLLINENMIKAEADLNQANCDNIIECCREYLQILTEYREDLYQLRGSSEINVWQTTPLARELVEQVRKAILCAVEITTRARNHLKASIEAGGAI